MPSITQLQYLLAVLRTGHFGRAAEACDVAQPTLSAQIQRAEQELGITIFDRGHKPVAPTPEGEQILAHAQEVVTAHQRLLWTAQGYAEEPSGDFSLGVIPTLAPYVLPWFLLRFSERYPKVKLSLYERPTDQLIEEMLHQRIDAAVLATPLGEAAITERPLFYDPFYLYAHAEEPLLAAPEVDPTDLDEAKLWLLEDGHCVRTQVVSYCKLSGANEHLDNVSFAAGSFETLRNLIDATGGYTLFPETYVRTLPRKTSLGQVRPLAPTTPTREVSVVHLRSTWKTSLIDALVETIEGSLPRSLRQVSPDGDILPAR